MFGIPGTVGSPGTAGSPGSLLGDPAPGTEPSAGFARFGAELRKSEVLTVAPTLD